MNLKGSQTEKNLMRAFAGESQARNRYDFAAEVAKQEGYFLLEEVFKYTASQEQAHAKVFIDHLKEFNGTTIFFDGGYPVDNVDSTLKLLKQSEHNENQEANDIYLNFAKIAQEEGFTKISDSFTKISTIENIHGKRFGKYAKDLEGGHLYKKDQMTKWMCTHCGYVYEGLEAPSICPVCSYPQGYYILFQTAEFE